jgi:hypothetical protein
MKKVMPARRFDFSKLGSLGNARYMLICQHNFPDTYEDRESVQTVDSDRLDNFFDICKRYELGNDNPFSMQGLPPVKAINFIKELMSLKQDISATGYRIMATVKGNGHTVWTFQLFVKDPGSTTKVYSGEDAPNVHA